VKRIKKNNINGRMNDVAPAFDPDNEPVQGILARLQIPVAFIVLTILVLFTYRNAFDNSFVDWDDFTYVVNNDLVRGNDAGLKEIFTTPVSSNYHPLAILSMRHNNNVCNDCPNGISAAPFIRWNVIFHILNTILIFILIYLLSGRNILIAFLTAALSGIHPMHVESVAWISERKDVLYSFFFLSGLIAYIKYITVERNKYFWLILTFLAFVLSCLSKATAVVFPLILILINYWYTDNNKTYKDNIKEALSVKSLTLLIPFFIVSLFTGILAFRLQNGQNFMGILNPDYVIPDVVNAAGPFTLWQKIQAGSYGFITYIARFFAPVGLSSFYPYPGTAEYQSRIVSIILAVAPFIFLLIISLAVLSIRKTKLFVFGTVFFLITIVLVLQFIPVGYAITADRYSYLPYIGIAFIVATLAVKSNKQKLLLSISICFIVFLGFLSTRRTAVWNNTETLWTDVIKKYPRVEIARRSRAKFYSRLAGSSKNEAEKSKYEDLAMADFSEAIKSGSKNADVYEGTGVILGSKGDYEKALKFLDVALKIDPENGGIYYNRALVLSNLNRNEEAINDYILALRYQPEKAFQIINNRSNLLLSAKRFKEALTDFDYLITANRTNPVYYYNRAYVKLQTNDIQGAIYDYQKVLELDPADSTVRDLLKKISSAQNDGK
jgi:protein O-mannosyl-transferase